MNPVGDKRPHRKPLRKQLVDEMANVNCADLLEMGKKRKRVGIPVHSAKISISAPAGPKYFE